MKKGNWILTAAGLLLLIGAGVGCERLTGWTGGSELTGTVWQLESFEAGGDASPVSDTYAVYFREDGKVTAQADCNTCPSTARDSTYAVGSDGAISVPRLACTEIACQPPNRGEEFIRALDTATSYELKESELRLFYDGGKVLSFEANDDLPVPGQ